MIKPVMLCGCETWTMTQRKKSSLKTWERKILRKMYGQIKGQNGWRLRTNGELQIMCFNDDTCRKAGMGWSSSKNV